MQYHKVQNVALAEGGYKVRHPRRDGREIREILLEQDDVIRFIGVTGLPGAGKGAFIDLLEPRLTDREIETWRYSLSDVLRAEARARGLTVERPVLRSIANELRREQGSGVLSLMVVRQIRRELAELSDDTPLVVIVDAIRNPDEVSALRQALGEKFILVAVEAPLELLVERIAARARYDEPDEFVGRKEAARQMILGESGKNEPAHGHNIARCVAMADWRVDNSQSIDEMAGQIDRLIEEIVPAPAE